MSKKYDTPEEAVRKELINPTLKAAGWQVQHYSVADVNGAKGVAVEYFQLGKDVGEADYILFVDGIAVGIIEAKKEGESLVGKEFQSSKYAKGFPNIFAYADLPLPFVYESNGHETRFTNLWDPKPRSRDVFSFHRPETLSEWLQEKKSTLRKRLSDFTPIKNERLWPVQKQAIENVMTSLAYAKPKALVQMATGSGKTYTAVNLCYNLIKGAKANRILFLVDRSNLGKQTHQEFQNFKVPNDGRKFTELYNVQRLTSNKIEGVNKVCISTIQRMYSMIKGKKLTEEEEDLDLFTEIEPLEYNPKIPIEEFDFIIVDECHRSIYNLWKQVLTYFDAFMIGLTATPSKHTIGFFDNNLVMEYTHEEAVADQINVDFTVYKIRTKITKEGSKIEKGEVVLKRDLRTRQKRWAVLEDEVEYTSKQLDKAVVAKDQIRKIIRTFRDKVRTEIFPGRQWVPKTLIYAKDDNHAEEIVKIVREEFNEGNDFAVKITYKTEGEKPEDLIAQFRNEPNPRIAVTVDMIATGTDIKPLEIVFFMRPVQSRNYFEQMKGRAVRVMPNDDFKMVTPDAMAKERFVIVDAVGVCENPNLNETRPLEQKKGVSFEKLLKYLQYGKPQKENISSMASRLSRLQKKLTEKQADEITSISGGNSLSDFARNFVRAIDEDKISKEAQENYGSKPSRKQLDEIAEKRMKESLRPFIGNTKLMQRLPEIKREVEQIIDEISLDIVEEAKYSAEAAEKAKTLVGSFREFISKNKDELKAIQMFYKKGRLKWNDLKELADKIKAPPYGLTTSKLWDAYRRLEDGKVKPKSKTEQIADFISLLTFEIEKTNELTPYLDTVEKRFAEWLATQKERGFSFTQEQLNWLELIKHHIATSVEIDTDDFEYGKLQTLGGLGRAAEIFGSKFNEMLIEINRKVGG